MRERDCYIRVFEADAILVRDIFMGLEAACFLFFVCSHETGLGISYYMYFLPSARVVSSASTTSSPTGQGKVGYADCPNKASTDLFVPVLFRLVS